MTEYSFSAEADRLNRVQIQLIEEIQNTLNRLLVADVEMVIPPVTGCYILHFEVRIPPEAVEAVKPGIWEVYVDSLHKQIVAKSLGTLQRLISTLAKKPVEDQPAQNIKQTEI